MLKLGFIGFGRMGITHFSILNTHPLIEIAAVCDQSKTMLSILKKYAHVETYRDYREMFSEVELDAVVISTPTDSHADVIKYAINRNLHVFVEKPLAMDPAQGKEIINLLQGKALVNQVGYVNRFNEVFAEVKKLIDKGVIGEIKNFQSEMYGATVLKDSSQSWRGRRKLGGGCMYEFASHAIDLAVYLIGQPSQVSGSVMQSIYSSQVEDFVAATLLYEHGTSGMLSVNWSDETYRKPTNIFTILGTKGKILADKHAYKIFLKERDKENDFEQGWNTRYITDFAKSVRFYVRGNEFTSQLDYFAGCILDNRTSNLASFEEGYKTDLLMAEIKQDATKRGIEDTIVSEGLPASSFEGKTDSVWKKFLMCMRGINA